MSLVHKLGLDKLKSWFGKVSTSAGKTQKAVDKLSGSVDELTREAHRLQEKLGEAFDADEAKRFMSVVDKIDNKLDDVSQGSTPADRLGSMFKINQVREGLESVTSALDGVINKSAQYSDAFADVRKTTGLTAEEVEVLQDRLEDIDTRTGVLQLAEISRVAGEFGLRGVANIEGFTAAVNKANVALGDHFGNSAETVAREMAKVKKLFAETKQMSFDQAITKIGSGLNEMGNQLGFRFCLCPKPRPGLPPLLSGGGSHGGGRANGSPAKQ